MKGSDLMQTNVLKVRNTIYKVIDTYFRKNAFYEVSPPILTSFSCETACVGGSDLISVAYYDKKAFLSQSAQLYLEALAIELERVYCINPAFRAESTLLTTHLTEFWMCEAEIMNITFTELIKNISDLLVSIVRAVLEENSHELEALNICMVPFEKIITEPLPQITYSDALDILRANHVSIEWGEDIQPSHELILCKYFNELPLIITLYPKILSSFYMKECPNNSELTLSFDIVAPGGYREIVGGSMRENNITKLYEFMQSVGIDISSYRWYIDIISSNSTRHGGYGLGIERLVSWLCNLSTIQDAIPFPRTEKKLWP